MISKEMLVTLAETEVAFRFQLSGTGMLFRSFKHKIVPQNFKGTILSVDMDRILEYSSQQKCSMEFAEYCCLLEETADYLPLNNNVIYHGVALIYGKGAYVLTAPSGTGKSTQYSNLRTMYGNRIRIINGDKPILGWASDGQIIVHPSPWTGKERWAGKEKAPLHGIILLEQGQTNIVRPMDMHEAVLPIIQEFIYTAKTRESVHTVFRMADTMLRGVPLYKLINKGDVESSAMLYDIIVRTEQLWH